MTVGGCVAASASGTDDEWMLVEDAILDDEGSGTSFCSSATTVFTLTVSAF